jgi:TPR repeat protein
VAALDFEMEPIDEVELRAVTRAALAVQLRRQSRQDAAEWLFRRAADAFFGWNAGPRKPFANGVIIFEAAEGLGHQEAAWLLGVLRAHGCVRRDTTKAQVRQWFLELSPDRRALFVAGGLSLEDDATRAFGLFEQSARLGYAKAMNRLGFCYNLGQGCAVDTVLGARWFASAAALGHAGAQFNLGYLHAVGQGVEQGE